MTGPLGSGFTDQGVLERQQALGQREALDAALANFERQRLAQGVPVAEFAHDAHITRSANVPANYVNALAASR